MKKKAYTYHHTHWDTEWYFTEQHSQVQFIYHMQELFEALDNGWIDTYHMDGKSNSMEDYFKTNPEAKEKFIKYVKEGKILIGPFYEQLSAFIAPGESIIKNLQLGMDLADEYGGSCKTAYLPDPFGQVQDYPKIMNGFGIYDFVFRRGMGDVHKLKNNFWWDSNDGSRILINVLQGGYSFAGLAFYQGRLIENAGLNLDKKGIISLMHDCEAESAIEGQFLFPAGKDNCPVMFEFKNLIKQYNEQSEDFEFIETTLDNYMKMLRESNVDFQKYQGELYTTQYHRVHKSIFSARPDIKITQDKTERMLIYEVQPLMTMLDKLAIPYEHGMVLEAWKLLSRSQTHSEATNSDDVNEQILARAKKAFLLAESLKTYLTRKIAVSVPKVAGCKPIVIFNTLPFKRDLNIKLNVYSKNKNFKLIRNGQEIEYSIITQEKVYGGWRRKHRELLDSGRDYYLSTIALNMSDFEGISYETIYLENDIFPTLRAIANSNNTYIENDSVRVELFEGSLSIRNKQTDLFIEDAIYFENSGDQGDTFDYDYPTKDLTVITKFKDAKVVSSYETKEMSSMTIQGEIKVPKDLDSRADGVLNETLPYELTLSLKCNSEIIEVKGKVLNTAYNHRLRLVIKTKIEAQTSSAGTQFGYVSRTTQPEELKYWKEKKWLEEPLPIEPLLNHVSLADENNITTIFTSSTKEYEIIGENFTDIALTLYRAVGHFGLPDLNRRPGRASGIPECIMECPLSQMIGKEIHFSYGIKLYNNKVDGNIIHRDYVEFATKEVYFEDQEYNRVFTPMKYFEVNSLTSEIPTKFNLLELRNSKAQFSTLEKSNSDDAYILRIFNNENFAIDAGELILNFNYSKLEWVDLRENPLKEASTTLGEIKSGEIKTIKIYIV
ncbi:hypothetical protein AN639_09735 [Candidatus Epulonipiscium fishelsonii]|uniref:Uncharacterized protein n=1 Tax=Candidatus Epulonipiscium fishelsonii TaxID=77094 RepID=A0ACC8XG46_9FIRM|nr:hypothetical protein AN639_09735 [Epulopiscium sp. SCG-B05WGA-EpuloA1]ONI42555.1 hypothetical protein AN396_13910 [Epulopiscium sp. SCG-B11WGA-EpuloA1]